jgi:GGDEF domain-containing protein
MKAELEKILRLREELTHDEVQPSNLFTWLDLKRKIDEILYEIAAQPALYARIRKTLSAKTYDGFIVEAILKAVELDNRIESFAKYDKLTSLYNRATFDALLNGSLELLIGQELKDAAQLLIDIDHFKEVNDLKGHTEGDKILTRVANIVKSNIHMPSSGTIDLAPLRGKKPGDIVGRIYQSKGIDFATLIRNEQAGRFGGEEIVVVLPENHIPEGYDVAERIRYIIENEFKGYVVGKRLGLTVSGGVQSFEKLNETRRILNKGEMNDGGELASDWFKQADTALYVAKELQRNKILTFEEAMKHVHMVDQKKIADILTIDLTDLKKLKDTYTSK